MTRTLSLLGFGIAISVAGSALAQDLPNFVKDTFPKQTLPSAAQQLSAAYGKESSLDPKTRELIALAASASVPCHYCIYYHQKSARKLGASEAEIRDALYTTGLIRQFSLILNGMAYDMNAFRSEVDAMFK